MTRICANGPFFVEGGEGSERNQGRNLLYGGLMGSFAGIGMLILSSHASGRDVILLKVVGGLGGGLGMATVALGAHRAVVGKPLPPEVPSDPPEPAKKIVEMSRRELTDLVDEDGWLNAELINEVYQRTGEGAEVFDYLTLKQNIGDKIKDLTPEEVGSDFGRDLSLAALEQLARVLPLEIYRGWLAVEIEACAGERVTVFGAVADEERLGEFLEQTDAWREGLNAKVRVELALKRPTEVTFAEMCDTPEDQLLSALRVMAARSSVTTAELSAMVAPWVKLFEETKTKVKPPLDPNLVNRAKKIREVLMKNHQDLHFPEPQ